MSYGAPFAEPTKAQIHAEAVAELAEGMQFSGEDIWEQIAFDSALGGRLEAALASGDTTEFQTVRSDAIEQLRDKFIRSNA